MTGSTHAPDYQLMLEVLRETRKRKGVPQVVLAERLGNTQTFVSKCERGERRLDIVEFVEFAEALDVSPEDVFAAFIERRSKRQAGRKKSARSST